MKKFVLLAFLLFAIAGSYGQNLIPNPGFEHYSQLPDSIHQWRFARPWQGFRTADYMHQEALHYRAQAKQPHTGKALMRIVLHYFVGAVNDRNEFIFTTLQQELEKDRVYYIEYFVKSERGYGSPPVVYLSDSAFTPAQFKAMLKDQIKVELPFENDSVKKHRWTKISGTYKAQGKERFFALGRNSRLKQYDTPQAMVLFQIDDVMLRPLPDSLVLEKGRTYRLENILFRASQYEILPASFVELQRFALALKLNSHLKIRIAGHTDSKGSPQSNMKLSQNRAKAVCDFFARQGIDKNRMEYKGYGSTKPVATNKTAQGRKLNRRVEISIVQGD